MKHPRPWPFLLDSALLFAVFVLLEKTLVPSLRLTENEYRSPSLLSYFLSHPAYLIPLFVFLGLLFFRFKELSWKNLETPNYLRLFILVGLGALALNFSYYDFNLFLNQGHVTERVLVITFTGLTVYHPVFALPAMLLNYCLLNQFYYPLHQLSLTDKKALLDGLTLFCTFITLRGVLKISVLSFVFLSFCLIAGNYFYAGFEKAYIGHHWYDWALHDNLGYLFINSHINGWLDFFKPEAIFSLNTLLQWVALPIKLFTLGIELGALLFFVRYRYALILLFSFALLHTGIFIWSGILFWEWIVFDLAAFFFLLRNQEWCRPLFKPSYIIFSILIFSTLPFYFSATRLGWFDTPLNQYYQIEAVDLNGNTYQIDRTFMSPYHLMLAQNRMYFLNDDSRLTFTVGAIDFYKGQDSFDRMQAIINSEGNQETLTELKKEKGIILKNEKDSEEFDRFVKNYFGNLNQRLADQKWMKLPFSPKHICFYSSYSPQGSTRYHWQSPIAKIRVKFLETYINLKNNRIDVLNNKVIREIEIIPSTSPATSQT